MSLHIAILGAGTIGGNLGKRWAALGHSVRFGVRDPKRAAEAVKAAGPNASAMDVAAAVRDADAVVLAVPWAAAAEVLKATGDLAGKVLIDCTNAVAFGPAGLKVSADPSAAEQVARMSPGARVVKAFNAIGGEHLLDPKVGGVQADTFLTGDDDAAKKIVRGLAEEIGFSVIDVGPLSASRMVEELAILWIHLAMRAGQGRNIAFKLLRG